MLALDPEQAGAWCNRGNALHALARSTEALPAYAHALELAPELAAAWINQGYVLDSLERSEEALASLERGLRLDPANALAWLYLGKLLADLERHDEALLKYARAEALDPGDPVPRWHIAHSALVLGRLREGWAAFESRWGLAEFDRPRHQHLPRLERLEDAIGARVLVWSEQGMGDTLQFCRYLPVLARHAAGIAFEAQPPLHALLGSLAGSIELLDFGQSPSQPVDWQIPLLSLPRLFGTDLSGIPAEVPYLGAPDDRRARWAQHLTRPDRPDRPECRRRRIAIACSGHPKSSTDPERSMPLAAFLPLCAGNEVYLCQRDVRDSDRTTLATGPITWLGDAFEDFADTAAALAQMDLVITVDTALAHLAGALGRPVWLLVPRPPEWRWMLAGTTSPWYPSARLFRQHRRGDWSGALADVEAALAAGWRN